MNMSMMGLLQGPKEAFRSSAKTSVTWVSSTFPLLY